MESTSDTSIERNKDENVEAFSEFLEKASNQESNEDDDTNDDEVYNL